MIKLMIRKLIKVAKTVELTFYDEKVIYIIISQSNGNSNQTQGVHQSGWT